MLNTVGERTKERYILTEVDIQILTKSEKRKAGKSYVS